LHVPVILSYSGLAVPENIHTLPPRRDLGISWGMGWGIPKLTRKFQRVEGS